LLIFLILGIFIIIVGFIPVLNSRWLEEAFNDDIYGENRDNYAISDTVKKKLNKLEWKSSDTEDIYELSSN
jgi:hypothetical protein